MSAVWRLADQQPARRAALSEEAFIAAQWSGQTSAGAALAQMAARFSKGEGKLSLLVREQQNLSGLWQRLDKQIIAARSAPTEKRNTTDETALAVRQAETNQQLIALNGRLTKEFPEYAALAAPLPLSIKATEPLLRSDEALVQFAFTKTEGFAWVVTRELARWVRLGETIADIGAKVQSLRCGLDQVGEWEWSQDKMRWLGRKTACATLRPNGLAAEEPPPFNLAIAHELYEALFASIKDDINGKHLLIVPAGPLTALPFQVLVMERPADKVPTDVASYMSATWLAKRHPITVLPSVASLKALREFAKASKATRPFIGFGNPLLTGPDGRDKRAWGRQTCKAISGSSQIASRGGVRSAIPRFFRGGLADVEVIRAQYPLPETADELCAVARSSNAAESSVYLGDKATETAIKALSANGTLAQARVLHFATHGLLAGETEMLAMNKAEPALILTPPQTATEENDGLLTASEITQLNLDADWVVLSACNTAGAENDQPGAEALSGLARAFFYAGGRAVLVSHWAVNSEATVKLITKAFGELKADSNIGRAEALRRSMLALIQQGAGNAHPANWAPFVVVGEGAR